MVSERVIGRWRSQDAQIAPPPLKKTSKFFESPTNKLLLKPRSNFELTQQLFDQMLVKDVVSWNAILSAYVQNGKIEKARRLFESTQRWALVSWNCLMDGYLKKKRLIEARQIFDRMPVWESSFSLSEFVAEFQEVVKPVLNRYIKENTEVLQKCSTAHIIERCKVEHRAVESQELFINKILDISEVDVRKNNMMGDSHIIIVAFQTRQVYCDCDRLGSITEGGQDTIHTVFFAWAMQQFNPEVDAGETNGCFALCFWICNGKLKLFPLLLIHKDEYLDFSEQNNALIALYEDDELHDLQFSEINIDDEDVKHQIIDAHTENDGHECMALENFESGFMSYHNALPAENSGHYNAWYESQISAVNYIELNDKMIGKKTQLGCRNGYAKMLPKVDKSCCQVGISWHLPNESHLRGACWNYCFYLAWQGNSNPVACECMLVYSLDLLVFI